MSFKFTVIAPKEKDNSTTESTDTEDMLSALRRQIQPHLVMALQGHNNASPPNYPHIQVRKKSNHFSAVRKKK